MAQLRSRKLVLLAIAILVLAGLVIAAQSEEVVVEEGDDIMLGAAFALSGEGLAPLGVDMQRGVELAQEDRPTVMVGEAEFSVSVDVQDSLCTAEGGQAVATRFTADENIVAVVGHMCSSSCAAAAPIYDSAGFTTVSPSCTSPILTLRGFESFNRAVPSDGAQGAVAAEFIFDELGVTTIATIHDGSPYGEGLVQVVANAFSELGGEVIFEDAITVGDTDFRGLLEEIASGETVPELIYFGGFPAEGARLIQQRADAGLEDVMFMGADGIQGTEVIELSGDAAEGVYASAPIATSNEALASFLERYVETYNEEPPAPFHANAYDAYNLILDGIEATATVDEDGNLVVNRAALAEYVRTFETFEGLTGELSGDGTGETFAPEQSIIAFFQVQDAEFVELIRYGGEEEMMDEDMEEEDMSEEEDMEEESEEGDEG